MTPANWVDPPHWTSDQLRENCAAEAEAFRTTRREEGPEAFAQAFRSALAEVQRSLSLTDNLRSLAGGSVFVDHPDEVEAFRYFCGPPISEEDLWTLVGESKFRRVPPALAPDVAAALVGSLDSVRFPWMSEGRAPTPQELDRATFATAVLMAARKVGTDRRGSASTRQEGEVAAQLEAAGFTLDPDRTEIRMVDQLQRGTFSRERKIHGKKCDLPVRLHDGRLLAIECKVSNGPKNGWKRLNAEVGGKAGVWARELGSAQVITAAVLRGIFDLSSLNRAQDAGVVVFWERRLDQFVEFVQAVESRAAWPHAR